MEIKFRLETFPLLLSLFSVTYGRIVDCYPSTNSTQSIFDFKIPDVYGYQEIDLSTYSGYVVLVVNVATYWALSSQYHQLNALQKRLPDFHILAFPCNQFNLQEPALTGLEIMNGIRFVRPGGGYVPTFQMFQKVKVNGENEHPLFTYLKSQCPPTQTEFSNNIMYQPVRVGDVNWNFEKFLVSREGKPVKRYNSKVPPLVIARDIVDEIRRGRPDDARLEFLKRSSKLKLEINTLPPSNFTTISTTTR